MFGGDEGLRVLTHYIGKLNLQVLALEHCQLTDASTPYIASILKVSAHMFTTLFSHECLTLIPCTDIGSAK